MKSKLNDLSDPNFNPICIQNKIEELDKAIDSIRKRMFSPNGVDVLLLQSKIAIRESLICNLKSLELLNKSE